MEFAVGIAAAGSKRRPALPYPGGLRPYFKYTRLDARALAAVRRCLHADDSYRSQLGLVATEDLVDAIGVVWLQRPPDWPRLVQALHEQAQSVASEARGDAALKRSERRREAAEITARRTQAEAIALGAQIQQERNLRAALESQLALHQRAVAAAEYAVEQLRQESALASKRLAETTKRVSSLTAKVTELQLAVTDLQAQRDQLLAEHAEQPLVTAIDKLPPPARSERTPRGRQPISTPGGLYGDSAAVAVHLLRTPRAEVIIDGYNLAKGAWPQLELVEQRERCIEFLENLVRRFSCRVQVVFDGADVVGANARRRLVWVQFSPAGVSADDVIRAEVANRSTSIPLVVVTDDQAILSSVRQLGANVVGCAQLLSVMRP